MPRGGQAKLALDLAGADGLLVTHMRYMTIEPRSQRDIASSKIVPFVTLN